MRFTSPCGNTEEQEIAKGIFLQTNVKSVPFSTLTLSVLMVIFILSEFVDFLLLKERLPNRYMRKERIYAY